MIHLSLAGHKLLSLAPSRWHHDLIAAHQDLLNIITTKLHGIITGH